MLMLLVMLGPSELVTLIVTAGVLAAVPVPVLAVVPVADGSMLNVELGEAATLCVMLLVMFGASELVTLGVPAGVPTGVLKGVPGGVPAAVVVPVLVDD
jgi:hypothetical protein